MLAATSSWVDSGLLAQTVTSAPPACSVRIRLAVSLVTCRQAAIRSPVSGFSSLKRLRIIARTGISWSAHSMRSLPAPARRGLATSEGTVVFIWVTPLRRTPSPRGRARSDGMGERRHALELEAGGLTQHRCAAGVLPGEVRLVTAEMSISCGLAVDRPAQIEVTDDGGRAHREVLSDQRLDTPVRDGPGAEAVGVDRDRLGDPDGVSQLDLDALGNAGGHQVLRDVAGHVAGGTVHLGGVLAGEGAAAMASDTAVGVDDDLAAGQAAVALRAADDEAAGGVDVEDGALVQQAGRDGGADHLLDHGMVDLVVADLGIVLGGDDDRMRPHRAVAFVFDGHLALAVGAQPLDLAAAARGGQLAGHAMCQGDGQRHQGRRVAAGVAEHQPLVAGAG